MIAAHEVELNRLYEVTHDAGHDEGVILIPIGVVNKDGFRQFRFLWLSGEYEGQVVTGTSVAFNQMIPLKLAE